MTLNDRRKSNREIADENLAKLREWLDTADVIPERGGKANISAIAVAAEVDGQDPFRDEARAAIQVAVEKKCLGMGVMNGDVGVAVADEEGGALRMRIDEGEKVLPAQMLEEDVELAYAITCQRAQGSQFPTVIVPVTTSSLLDRTLLLTAVSRAQQQVVIIGDADVFAMVVVDRQPASLAREVGLGR